MFNAPQQDMLMPVVVSAIRQVDDCTAKAVEFDAMGKPGEIVLTDVQMTMWSRR
ncbi:hypothetical protein HY948_02205 [Candidatus Gottesmanbacteria bacterium]|nr:hypothetical protein [Candidatus Gottesmanbacteria bacterium]